MFDITYLGRRWFRFIKRYPRTRITVGFLFIFFFGIWVGRTVQFGKIADYVRSFFDTEQSDVTRLVRRGIVHRQIKQKGMLTNILAVSPNAADIRPYRALNAGIGTESLVSLARRHKALVAINGGYFEMEGPFRGESVGALKINGEWVSEPEQGRAVIGFRAVDGKTEAYIDRVALWMELVLPSQNPLIIDGINRNRGRDELVLYRPYFHTVTLTMPDGVEVVVENDQVVGIYDRQGSLHIPSDGYVLSASGKQRTSLLAAVAIGDRLQIRKTLIPERVGNSRLWASCEHIIGGGPLLLRNGIATPRRAYEVEGFDRTFHSFWHPRTAIGRKADGTLLFVTITSTEAGVRRGVTLPKMTQLFLEWGATDALNLDGGASSMLIIQDEVVSVKQHDKKQRAGARAKPARGNRRIRPLPKQQGRAIADALLIFPR